MAYFIFVSFLWCSVFHPVYSFQSLNCTLDVDCYTQIRPIQRGGFICEDGLCSLKVAPGELCRRDSDCILHYYDNSTSLCSSIYCEEGSLCDTPYGHYGVSIPLPTRSPLKCCRGRKKAESCAYMIDSKVNICGSGLKCEAHSDDSSPICRDVEDKEGLWIGILLGVCGSFVLNFGLNLKKWAMNQILVSKSLTPEDCDKIRFTEVLNNPYWLFGFSIFITGNICNFIALKYAPQSVLAPLGSVSLIANVIFAPLINKEVLRITDGIGILFILIGSVLVVVFSGTTGEPKMAKLCSVIYFISIAILICLIFLFIYQSERKIRRNRKAREILKKKFGDSRRISNGFENHGSLTSKPEKEVSIYSEGRNTKDIRCRFLLPFSYAALGGMMASYTMLLAKSSVNLVVVSIVDRDNQFSDPISIIILLGTIFTAVSQVYWINRGLQRYDALIQIPVFQVVWVCLDVLGGIVVFNEMKGFDVTKYLCFMSGILCNLIGVSVLSKRVVI